MAWPLLAKLPTATLTLVTIRFEDRSEARGLLRSGGQADVTIYTSGNWITNALAWLWMRFITIMSYAY